MTETTAAYYHHGEWIADCPRNACANAEYLFGLRMPGHPVDPVRNPREIRKPIFLCSNCQQMAQIVWPPQEVMERVAATLSVRPVPDTRNWYPENHPGAIRFGVTHGQTIEQLEEESRANGIAC